MRTVAITSRRRFSSVSCTTHANGGTNSSRSDCPGKIVCAPDEDGGDDGGGGGEFPTLELVISSDDGIDSGLKSENAEQQYCSDSHPVPCSAPGADSLMQKSWFDHTTVSSNGSSGHEVRVHVALAGCTAQHATSATSTSVMHVDVKCDMAKRERVS